MDRSQLDAHRERIRKENVAAREQQPVQIEEADPTPVNHDDMDERATIDKVRLTPEEIVVRRQRFSRHAHAQGPAAGRGQADIAGLGETGTGAEALILRCIKCHALDGTCGCWPAEK